LALTYTLSFWDSSSRQAAWQKELSELGLLSQADPSERFDKTLTSGSTCQALFREARKVLRGCVEPRKKKLVGELEAAIKKLEKEIVAYKKEEEVLPSLLQALAQIDLGEGEEIDMTLLSDTPQPGETLAATDCLWALKTTDDEKVWPDAHETFKVISLSAVGGKGKMEVLGEDAKTYIIWWEDEEPWPEYFERGAASQRKERMMEAADE